MTSPRRARGCRPVWSAFDWALVHASTDWLLVAAVIFVVVASMHPSFTFHGSVAR